MRAITPPRKEQTLSPPHPTALPFKGDMGLRTGVGGGSRVQLARCQVNAVRGVATYESEGLRQSTRVELNMKSALGIHRYVSVVVGLVVVGMPNTLARVQRSRTPVGRGRWEGWGVVSVTHMGQTLARGWVTGLWLGWAPSC